MISICLLLIKIHTKTSNVCLLSGINVYDKSNKLAPKISFPWSEIKNISHTAEKFKVKLNEKNVKPFEGTTKGKKIIKYGKAPVKNEQNLIQPG